MKRTPLAGLFVLGLTLPAAAQHGVLYQIPGWSQALGISADGNTVVGRSGANAVSYDLSTNTSTTVCPGYATSASSDGSVIVGYDNNRHLFRWTQPTGAVQIGTSTQLYYPVISADGRTVVGTDGAFTGYRWDETSGRQQLGLPGDAIESYAYAVSADGSVIVGNSAPHVNNTAYATVWHGTSPTIVSPEGSTPNASLDAVSSDGSVAFGWHLDGSPDSFRWSAASGQQELGFPQYGWPVTIPTACSADGSIFVGDAFGQNECFVWRQGNAPRLLSDILQHDFNIDLHGAHLIDVRGLSADGTVLVGTAQGFSWVVTLPWSIPSPASATPLLALILAPRRH